MSKRDYYAILSVSKTATDDEIKKSYRRLAMKYHPDRNPNDKASEEKFKEAKEAYEILSNPERRAIYDQLGHAGLAQGQGGYSHAGAGHGEASFSDIFGDVFGDFFGGRQTSGNQGGRSRPQKGPDFRYSLTLTLEQAVFGKTIEITIPSVITCESCQGTGARKGSKPVSCMTCHGAGQVRIQQGFFSIQQTCPDCHGNGQVIQDPCPDCRGHGRKQMKKNLSVKIPPGINEGDTIRLTGEGEAGFNNGPSGDLYVQVHIQPHAIFQRQGNDLICEAPIGFSTAALGGELEVPTLEGRIKLKIPPETQHGKMFRLRGKGVVPLRGRTPGDLICRVVVETPVNLSTKQKELLRDFNESLKSENCHNPKSSSWFTGVKKFFEDLKK